MDIRPSEIEQFKELYAKHFNIKLSDSMAKIKLCMLVRQAELVFQPLTTAQIEYVNEHVDERRSANNSRTL